MKIKCSTLRVICTLHVRPTRSSSLRTTTDSSDKKIIWCILLYCRVCLYPNTILMEAGWTTVRCPETNLSTLIFKSSARTKQSVIRVALKTPVEIRLGIYLYKTPLLHRRFIYFTPSCPPHLQLRPWVDGLHIGRQHGGRFVLLRHTHRPHRP